MGRRVDRQARRELIDAIRVRYREATKDAKQRILDEFVAVTGYHRKHAIRLLAGEQAAAPLQPITLRRVYDEAAREALIAIWEASGRIGSKRLKAWMPQFIASGGSQHQLGLDTRVQQCLLSMSAATIDRLLAPTRGETPDRKRPTGPSRLDSQRPPGPFPDWNATAPGFLRIDLVFHHGHSVGGPSLTSLIATDIGSGWMEAMPLLTREPCLVVEALEMIRRQLPMTLRGVESENENSPTIEFLMEFCRKHGIEFTQCLAYRGNGQPWMKQQTGRLIQQYVGNGRLSGVVAGQTLARLYRSMCLCVNFFQPSFQSEPRRHRDRAIESPAATPCDRLLNHPDFPAAAKKSLRSRRSKLDPSALLHCIGEAQMDLAALTSGELDPDAEVLDLFLAELPDLLESEELSPASPEPQNKARNWRTRQDPFEGVWSEVLLWLQEDPQATAKSLFRRLKHTHAEREFQKGQLRTFQRRVRQWRIAMAQQQDENGLPDGGEVFEGGPTAQDPAAGREP